MSLRKTFTSANPAHFFLANNDASSEFAKELLQFCNHLSTRSNLTWMQRNFFLLKHDTFQQATERTLSQSQYVQFLQSSFETIHLAVQLDSSIQIENLLNLFRNELHELLNADHDSENINKIKKLMLEVIQFNPAAASEANFFNSFLEFCLKVDDAQLMFAVVDYVYQTYPTNKNTLRYIIYANRYAIRLEQSNPNIAEKLYLQLLDLLNSSENIFEKTAKRNRYIANCYSGLGSIHLKIYATEMRKHDEQLYTKYVEQALNYYKIALAHVPQDKSLAHILISCYEKYSGALYEMYTTHQDSSLKELALTSLDDACELALRYKEIRKLGTLQIHMARWLFFTFGEKSDKEIDCSLACLTMGLDNLLFGIQKESNKFDMGTEQSVANFHSKLHGILNQSGDAKSKVLELFKLVELIHTNITKLNKSNFRSRLFENQSNSNSFAPKLTNHNSFKRT